MRTTINDKKNLKAFMKAASHLGFKGICPIRLMCNEKKIAVEAFNDEEHFVMFLNGTTETAGDCVLLLEWLSGFAGNKMTIDTNGCAVHISDELEHREFDYTGICFEPMEFPAVNALALNAGFHDTFLEVSRCIRYRNADIRPNLQCVRILPNGDVAASDGKCICVKKTVSGIDATIRLSKSLYAIGSILFAGSLGDENLIAGSNWICSQRKISKYPDIYQVLPVSQRHEIVVPKEMMQFIKANDNEEFKCTIKDSSVTLEGWERKAEFAIPKVDYEKVFFFDSKLWNLYVPHGETVMRFNDDRSIITLKDSETTYCFMPLRG